MNEIEGNISPELDIPEGADLLVIGDDQTWLTHGLHKYPAKFIPELPRWAIRKYSSPGDTILDPFAGSGTTNVEAMLKKRNSYAVDIDPLALFLIKVKSTPLFPDKLRKSRDSLLRKINEREKPKELPSFKNRDHWFQSEVTERLSLIKECIEEEGSEDIRDFFLVTFSSIIRDVSNADPGSHKPCVRKNLDRNIPGPIEEFTKKLKSNVSSMLKFSTKADEKYLPSIVEKDALDIHLGSESVDLAVTSPPYINALDYARTHKLEYYWLGYFDDSLVDLKKKFVGTEKVYSGQYSSLHKTGMSDLDEIIERIYQSDKKRSYIVYKFYEDMEKNLEEIRRVLKPGSKYVMFIGSNQIKDITISNYRFIRKIAKGLGFDLVNYFKSGVINHYIPFDRVEKIDKDYVLVLEK